MIKQFLFKFIIASILIYKANAMEAVYKPIDTMSVSLAGVQLIERFEGFRGEIYNCIGGKPTIGYGHVVKENEGEKFSKGITQEDARALLIRDLKETYVTGLIRQVKVPLTQYQFDALASFIYNLGEENLRQSTLLTLLNEEKYDQASPQFPRWCHANKNYVRGLFKRRIAEMFIFQNALTLPEELKTIKRAGKETLFELYEALSEPLQLEAVDIYLEYRK